MGTLNITSEIGTLKRVVIHSPGPEIEGMTPREAVRDLYNDIIPLPVVGAEHARLKSFLASVCRTYELTDLLRDTLADGADRAEFLTALASLCPVRDRIDELMSMAPDTLARTVVEGLPAKPGTLAARLDPRSFSIRPLPNAYFMRDTAAVFRDCVVSCATAYDVRLVEALVTGFIFRHHPEFLARSVLFDGQAERNRFVTLEGGDMLVLSRRVIALGVSERTTSEAVERLACAIARTFDDPVVLFAVLLPMERASIHLDMVFTMIDRDAALVHSPVIAGRNPARTIRIEPCRSGGLVMRETPGLLAGLAEEGIDLEPVECGGADPLHQEREQWLSGANSFAFAPGKILMYSCNARTLEGLAARGFAVRPAESFLGAGAEDVGGFGRLAVTFDGIELARGGGGARCMTLPVERGEP